MARLLIDSGGKRRVYEILEDRLTVGRDPGNQVRLQTPFAAAHHLLLSRDAGGYLVESVGGGAAFRVNGEDVETHALRHGDRIEIGDVVLVYLEQDGPEPAATERDARDRPRPRLVEPGAPPSLADVADQASMGLGLQVRGSRAARRTREQPRPSRSWAMASAMLFLAGAAVYFLLQIASASGFGKSAESLVNLAESQAARGALESALDTLKMARERTPDQVTARRIESMEARVESGIRLRGDEPLLRRAAAAFQLMQKFEQVYLSKDASARPASRELVRMADEWLASYRAICARYDEYAIELSGVERLRATYAPTAALGEPDSAADVIFRARTRVRLRNRKYREAIEILTGHLAGAAPAERDGVEEYRTELFAEGDVWLERRLNQVRQMIRGKHWEDAADDVEFLRRDGLPAWAERIDAVGRELAGAREKL